MDQFFSQQYPHISEAIFEKLDNKTLANCIQVGEEWNNLRRDSPNAAMILLKRRMQYLIELHTNFDTEWKNVIYAMSTTHVFALYDEIFGHFRGKLNNFQPNVTPLHWAASFGNLSVYRVFFELVHDKNPQDNEGYKPIHVAATDGNLKIIKEMVRNLQDINPSTNNGNTVLDIAVSEGHLNVVEYIVGLIGYSDLPITALLHNAAENGYLEIYKLLALNSTDKNPIKLNGITALHKAAKYGHLKICQFIMKDLQEKSPMDIDSWTPLHYTAYMGHSSVYEEIANDLTDKNPSDVDGVTPLHIAARRGHTQLCAIIIDEISEKNPRDFHGNTPLHNAAITGNSMLCEIITEEIEDKNPANNQGVTPMHLWERYQRRNNLGQMLFGNPFRFGSLRQFVRYILLELIF